MKLAELRPPGLKPILIRLVLEQNHDKRALKRIFQSVDFLENQHSKALTSGIPIVILL